MEFSPVGPTTDDHEDAQELMFEHAAEFPGHDLADLPETSSPADALPAEERDDYAEPPLSQERDWDPSEMPGSEETSAGSSEPQIFPNADPESTQDSASVAASDGPLTMGDFAALEERVLRAVSLVRRERQARLAAEQRAEVLEGRVLTLESQLPQLQADAAILEQLQQEVETLRAEREQVRQRVDRLLGQLDALEL